MTSNPAVDALLSEAEREVGRFEWDGTFADYLRMVIQKPALPRVAHKLVYDAIIDPGQEESPSGQPVYKLFSDQIFGLDEALANIVRYFSSSANRLEIRKRILLLLGPPASGKSSVVALIKQALERYTRTEPGAVYAIKGCPMQEEPLHLLPHRLRPQLMEDYGIYVEGELCPRCRYVLRTQHKGKISEMRVERVVFSEHEAVGIGYYVATNPHPADASLLVGSVDTSQLAGQRPEVAGRAFRLDGEFNVANRGVMELVEIFKADRHLLTTLLGLAQEQLIKLERFGSVYADEVVIGHSNEGDFEEFKSETHSEALKDRIIEVRIPYNLRVSDEVKIYQKMLASSGLEDVHLAPLTLPSMSIFAVLTRLSPPPRQGMRELDKLRLYDDQPVPHFSLDDVAAIRRKHPEEGMNGISPRYVMNRLSTVATSPDVNCVSPLNALDSLWRGLGENISLETEDRAKYVGFVRDAVEEYKERAVQQVQKAYEEGFEQTATDLLANYLQDINAYCNSQPTRFSAAAAARFGNERDMREMEKHLRISDKDRAKFRLEVHQFFSNLKGRNVRFDYTVEPRIKAAIEARLFPDRRRLDSTLTAPRSQRNRVEWMRRRSAVYNRLVNSYGYCPQCAEDTIEFVGHVLKSRQTMKILSGEAIEWLWDLNPSAPAHPTSDEQPDAQPASSPPN